MSEWLNKNYANVNEVKALNEYLQTHMYVEAGARSATETDVKLHALLHSFVSRLTNKKQLTYVNVCRWFDHIQQTGKCDSALPKISFSLFAPPVQRKLVIPECTASTSTAKPAAAAAVKASTSKPAAAGNIKSSSSAQPSQQKQQQKGKQPAKKQQANRQPKKSAPVAGSPPSRLHIVVGRVLEVKNHPDSETLYVEMIDVGEPQPRQVVSGLRNFISIEEFTNKQVLVMINLRPSKFRGVMSSGMVMCASSQDHATLEVLSPPEGVAIGERVNIEGEDGEPDALLPKKKSPWEVCAPKFLVDAKGVCGYDGKALTTSKGVITCNPALAGGRVG